MKDDHSSPSSCPPSPDVEAWRPVAGSAGRYEASSFGRIRATFQPLTGRPRGAVNEIDGQILGQWYGAGGYKMVHLDLGKRTVNISVAACVLAAFTGPRPSRRHRARFLDGDKHNLHLSNLRWLTAKQSQDLTAEHGHARRRTTKLLNGKLHYQCTKCMDWLSEKGFYHLKGGKSRLGNKLTACNLSSECRQCMNRARSDRRRNYGDGKAPSLLARILPILEQLDGIRIPADEPHRARVGQRLASARIRAGLSRAEVARRTGIHPQTIDQVELGINVPREKTIAKIIDLILACQ